MSYMHIHPHHETREKPVKKPEIPPAYQKDLDKAIQILTEAGCKEVLVFGSLAQGALRKDSDIDLAVRGCPPGVFFKLLGQLLLELDHPVDLVDLNKEREFGEYLEREGNLIRVS